MKYIEVTVYTSRDGIEPVSNMLMEMEIGGIIVENPEDVEQLLNKKNSYDWDYVDESVLNLKNVEPNVKFYLESDDKGLKKLDEIMIKAMMLKGMEYEGAFGLDVSLGRMYVENKIVDDEDWKDNWKEFFKTVRVTDKLIIKPSWEEYVKENKDDLIIEIDPGMAFGTGTHATTSLCLKLLEKYIKKGDCVLDIGCGSGILSIASGLLGAEKTLGIEIDPVAVKIAKENVGLNCLLDRVDVEEGNLTEGVDFRGDVVVANLMADLVISLTGDIANHIKNDGVYISSGILLEKRQLVEEKILEKGFEILETLEENEWCAIAAKYRG